MSHCSSAEISVFHLVTFAWLFFRANTLSDAVTLIENGFRGALRFDDLFIATMGAYEFILALIAIGILEILSLLTRDRGFSETIAQWPIPARFGVLYLLLFAIVVGGQFDLREFIYFQF